VGLSVIVLCRVVVLKERQGERIEPHLTPEKFAKIKQRPDHRLQAKFHKRETLNK